MAELLLSYAADEILKKLQSVVTDQITGARGLEDDLEKLRDSMGRLQSFLQKAQSVLAAGEDESIKRWLEKLQKVVYAAADVLDEFDYETLRRKVEIKNPLKDKVREFFSPNNHFLFRGKMAAKVKEVSESLEEMEEQAQLILPTIMLPPIHAHVERGVVQDSQPDRRTDSFLDESRRPIGRTEEVKRIVKILQVSSDDVPRLSVISIVGLGGLGKTTLAQLVCEEAKREKLFDEIMWVCVSDAFDIQKILAEMLQKLDSTFGGLSSMDVIVGNLQQKLKDKSFLLFLDDVWNKESENWKNLKRRLENICGKSGNFVIVTTRGHDVANIMGTQHMVELEQLSQTECWSIIKERIVGNEGLSQEMETIGMEIAKKCGGVPLAAKVVGGVLCSRMNRDEWLSIQHSHIWNEVDEGKKILGVLKLSFDHLPPPQKLCFAYCSLFPKDFVFDKAQLIQLWMAEDFLRTTVTNGGTSAKSMEDVGEKYFHSLLNNSFFQDTQVDNFGDIVGCKMHDLLHDLALSISKSQKLQCGLDCIQTSNGCRLRCSCHWKCEVQDILGSSKEKTRDIRCLFCRVDVSPMLSNFGRLRSLHIVDTKLKYLPATIRKLKHLRYLDISNNRAIQVLPKSITKLYHLQTLKVFNCWSLKELPKEIRNLMNLRHIGFNYKRLMPLKVGALTNLQTLPIFVVGLQEGETINELEGLKELRGELVVCNLENVRDKREAERARIKEKKLSRLGLEWMEVEENEVENFCSSREDNHEEVMEGIGAPTNIKDLRVEWYMGKQFSQWMSELGDLVKLELKNCRKCMTMPTLWHLRNLKILWVYGLNSMKVIGNEFYGESNNVEILFPSLEEFHIREMKSLVEWVAPKETKIFPRLLNLLITGCPNLKSFPLSQSISSPIAMTYRRNWFVGVLCFVDFKSLQEIVIMSCPKLTFAHIGSTSHQYWSVSLRKYSIPLEDEKFKNFSLCSNELVESWKWMSITWPIEMISQCPKSLEALEINNRFYEELPVDIFHGLSCLKHLEINMFKSIPSLSSLTKLVHLEISSLYVESIPSLPCLTFLEYLKIIDCANIESIPSLSSLTSLKHLHIRSCWNLQSIPNMSSLTSLKHLHVSHCISLESIPNMSSLTSLKHLHVSHCSSLESIPNMSSITSLKHLHVSHCISLESIPNMSSLTSLKHLHVSHCSSLESIPNMSSLKTLAVIYCRMIVSIDDDVLGSLTQLKELEWGGFSRELDQLPGLNLIHLLTSLQKLKIIGGEKMTSLPHQLQHLTSITQLEIKSFNGVECLPDWICKLSSLQTLSISECKNLKNLPTGIQRLSKLTSFEIRICPLLIERCAKDVGLEWCNISHIPRIEMNDEVIQDVRCGRNAEISS